MNIWTMNKIGLVVLLLLMVIASVSAYGYSEYKVLIDGVKKYYCIVYGVYCE